MKIGVISDTHDRLPTFKQALAQCKALGVDAIIHPGDFIAPFAAKLIAPDSLGVPLYCVYGNNDGERAGLKKMLPNVQDGPLNIDLDGKKIVIAHFIDWLSEQDIAAADIIITGHTHSASVEHKEGKLFLNPGECCGWVNGRCTFAILEPQAMQATIHDVE